MTALLRYQAALLLRSQRWLAPFLLYAVFVGVGVNAGEPVLGALGYTVAGLVPIGAWAVRICLGQEPPAARAVTAAAAGRTRAHLAAILTGTAATLFVGAVAVVTVTALSGHRGVSPLAAGAEGLLAATVCVLTGTAVGALTTRPLVASRGWSLTTLLLGSLLALVTTGSPAKAAVSPLVTAAHTATVSCPWPALAGALVLGAAAVGVACRATAWWE
ncbi:MULTISPECIES: ABC transporter [unclassified Streptomyces]|uniref:ABC transporter n=1 Tax=unclassified Streptomyces TaxID=2593676 RepID=UPI002E371D08|nr:ABC transporter [Streptomyces sp. NBC_01268]